MEQRSHDWWKESVVYQIRACDARGIRVLMDLVANHTSDECAWFVASRSDRNGPKRDGYLFRTIRRSWGSGSCWGLRNRGRPRLRKGSALE